MKREELSVEEIAEILNDSSRIERLLMKRMDLALITASGMPAPIGNPTIEFAQIMVSKLTNANIAQRLVADDRSVELIQKKDYLEIIELAKSTMMSNISSEQAMLGSDSQIDSDAMNILSESYAGFVSDLIDRSIKIEIPGYKSRYDYYNKLIDCIVSIAVEKKVSVSDALATEEDGEKLERMLYPRDEFINIRMRIFDTMLNPKTMIQQLATPLIGALSDSDQEFADEMKQDIETELLPEITRHLDDLKSKMRTWLEDEADRIYLPKEDYDLTKLPAVT